MNSIYMDVDGFGPEVKEKELISIIQNRKEDKGRQMAFKTLVQRKSKKAKTLAISILNHPFYDRRLKLTAANFLGKDVSKEGVRSLGKELKSTESKQLRSRILRSIGKAGGLEALKEIEGIKSKEASFARSLIAYRHGIKDYLLPAVKTKSFSKRSTHAKIGVIAITPARKKELNTMIETELDILGAYRLPKQKLNCAGNDLYIMQSESISDKDLVHKMLEVPAIPMKIFSVGDCPRQAILNYYVMTTPIPGKANEINVQLVTPSGKTAYTGSGILKGQQLELSIGTAEETIYPASQIKGTLNAKTGKIEFTTVLSHTKLEIKKRRIPKKVI